VLLGLSSRATKATTFDHTTVGVVELTPHREQAPEPLRNIEAATKTGP
jgi:hypothetical protein